MAWWNPFRREVREELVEASAGPARTPPPRQGFEYGISQQGLTEYNQGTALSGTDRRQLLTHLYEAYLACPWSWAAVNAIARRVTAGDLQMDWDPQDGQDPTEDRPKKPANVLAFERLLAYCNPRENIRQLIRGIVADLLVFGDAYVEVLWIGKQPVALYSLDAPSMLPLADEHGQITGYVQVTEHYQRATFEPREVIHISLDSPRSGVFGVSPTYAALLPITSWLFTAATLKETYRKGNPLNIHVDLPGSADSQVWLDQYMAKNIGPRGIGRPIVTKNGGKVGELGRSSIADLLQTLDQRRDEIIAAYGVPPAQAGIIESGNLGGGTGESQQKTFEIMTCDPIAGLILEALYFHLGVEGFGIEGWKLKFGDVDLRDSSTVEEIREKRLQNGAWSLNRYRADIGEPAVDGGEDPVLMGAATANIVRVKDLDASAKAQIAKQVTGTQLEIADAGKTGDPVELVKAKEEKPPPNQPPPPAGQVGPGGRPPFGRPPQGAGDEQDEPQEALLESLAEAGVARFVDESGAEWEWSVEETRYVRTAAGARRYGVPIGSPIPTGKKRRGGDDGGTSTSGAAASKGGGQKRRSGGRYRPAKRTKASQWVRETSIPSQEDEEAAYYAGTGGEGDMRLAAIWRVQGFDAKPTVISREEYEQLDDSHVKVYRGIGGEKAAEWAEDLRSGEAFAGIGVHGSGIYATTREATATDYAEYNPGGLLRMALRPEAKVITEDELDRLADRWLMEAPELEDNYEAYHAIASNPGRLAAAMGYDAIRAPGVGPGGQSEDYYVIVNRSALLVEEA